MLVSEDIDGIDMVQVAKIWMHIVSGLSRRNPNNMGWYSYRACHAAIELETVPNRCDLRLYIRVHRLTSFFNCGIRKRLSTSRSRVRAGDDGCQSYSLQHTHRVLTGSGQITPL